MSSPEDYVFPGARGGQLGGHYLGERVRVLRERAGLRDALNVHSFRHTFGYRAVRAGMDVYTLKEIMGHTKIEVTQRYARLLPSSLRSAMDNAFGEKSGQLTPATG